MRKAEKITCSHLGISSTDTERRESKYAHQDGSPRLLHSTAFTDTPETIKDITEEKKTFPKLCWGKYLHRD